MSGLGMALAILIADPVILGTTQLPLAALPEAVDTFQAEADTASRMTVEVAIHDTGPYRFLIDTGSQRTVLSTSLAGALGLTQGPQVRIVGVAGRHDVPTARVDTIAIGRRAFRDLTVPLLERDDIGADGILGTDSLQHQRVLLDFTRNTISIGDAMARDEAAEFDIVVRAKRRSGRLILTNAMIDGVRTDVVIDTGASGTIGNRALQRALARKHDKPTTPGALSSVTGQDIAADFAVADRLELGVMDLSSVIIAYADAPAFAELKLDRSPAVFLGMRELRAFRRVAIDFTGRKVLFDLAQ